MGPHEVAPFVLGILTLVGGSLVLIFRGPLGRAIAKRIEGGGRGGLLEARVAELEQRLAEVEQERHRVAELEERLDFTERLLASANVPAKEEVR